MLTFSMVWVTSHSSRLYTFFPQRRSSSGGLPASEPAAETQQHTVDAGAQFPHNHVSPVAASKLRDKQEKEDQHEWRVPGRVAEACLRNRLDHQRLYTGKMPGPERTEVPPRPPSPPMF